MVLYADIHIILSTYDFYTFMDPVMAILVSPDLPGADVIHLPDRHFRRVEDQIRAVILRG